MNLLYGIFISPIEMIVDVIFSFFINEMPQLGVFAAILGVSLCINFFALPLYNIAESLQQKERKIQKKMEYRVKRIKETFKGDERFMIISEYYRQNGYHPLYALRSALSILIEIPFFIAAYNYLSHCTALSNASFWIFKDLGSPDGLLWGVNVLPILMTLINFVSGAVYTRDAPRSEKIQLYVVAALFLVLLYNSPSGLVLYWILNNIFSLIKNIVLKTKNPGKILHICVSVLLVVLTVFVWALIPSFAIAGKITLIFISLIVALLPLETSYLKKKFPKLATLNEKSEEGNGIKELANGYFWIFFLSALGLALLAGYLLPSNAIATDVKSFSFLGNTENPLTYIWDSFYLFAGLFIIWPLCIYKMFGKKIRKGLSVIFFTLFVCALCNVYLFAHDYGEIENNFLLNHPERLNDVGPFFSLLPLLAIALAAGILILVKKIKKPHFVNIVLIGICFAEFAFSIFNTTIISSRFSEIKEEHEKELALLNNEKGENETKITPVYKISKNGKNVVVIFLDRAIGSFYDDIMEELNISNQYKDFVYYPNTLSYGNYTLLGAPAMMGGYDFTPDKINEMSGIDEDGNPNDELRVKHNMASIRMPEIFKNAGWNVLVTDPPFPNYKWSGDLTAFNKAGIPAVEIAGKYTKLYEDEVHSELVLADKYCRLGMQYFSFIQMIYPAVRQPLYNAVAHFLSDGFNNKYSSLYYMTKLTEITDDSKNNFIFIDNETPHTQAFLNVEPYEYDGQIEANKGKKFPAYTRQITNHDEKALKALKSRKFNTFEKDGSIDTIEEMHYDVNAASLRQVGKWLQYLQDNGVYDNTRIIIVSDHGRDFVTEVFENEFNSKNRPEINPTVPAFFNPLLLVKDFKDSKNTSSSSTWTTDEKLMTNADTIYLAVEGLNKDGTNLGNLYPPANAKESVKVFEIFDQEWNSDNLGGFKTFTLTPEATWIIKDDLRKLENWKRGDK